MTLLELKLIVLEALEAKSRAGRALEDFFEEGSRIVVRVDDKETVWKAEDVNFETLRVKAHRDTGGAFPLRASFGLAEIIRKLEDEGEDEQ